MLGEAGQGTCFREYERQPVTDVESESGGLADATVVGVGRFELPTSRSRTVRSSLTELHPAEASPYHHWRNHILADSLKGVEAQLMMG